MRQVSVSPLLLFNNLQRWSFIFWTKNQRDENRRVNLYFLFLNFVCNDIGNRMYRKSGVYRLRIRLDMVSFDQGEGWRWGWTLKSDCWEVSPWTRHTSNCLVSTHMSGHRKESIPRRWRNWTYRLRAAARRPDRCSRLWPWSWESPRSCRLHCEQTLQCNCDDAQPLRRAGVHLTLVNGYTRLTVTSVTQ